MKLVAATHPILVSTADPVDFPSKTVSKTASEMLRFMVNNHGCGLAAPQVGLPLRMFTYKHGMMGVVINPVIIEKSPEEVEMREGCLTYPGQFFKTRRSKSIVVGYQDLGGRLIEKTIDGFLAIIFQHETDHLDGRLVVQHGTPIEG